MFIDLTHRLNTETPVYPGDPTTEITPADTIESAGYLGHSLQMGTHAGTHIDAPAHMLEDGKTLDKFNVDDFVGPARYILLKNGVFTVKAVQEAGIQAGDIVIFNTQMSYQFYSKEYFTEYPVMTQEIADYLVEQKVKMVGVDTCSFDNEDSFPIHKTLLAANILLIENLRNVEQLSGHQATIYALPMRLDLDGSPARVIAEIN